MANNHFYITDATSQDDYYPFGMLLPNTNIDQNIGLLLADDDYRYGFNGMEKDDEIHGEGNSYSAQYW